MEFEFIDLEHGAELYELHHKNALCGHLLVHVGPLFCATFHNVTLQWVSITGTFTCADFV